MQVGVSPLDFWNLTPFLCRHATSALADGRSYTAWLTAALTRAKKMPKLNDLLTNKPNRDRAGMEAGLKAALRQAGMGKKGK